MYLTLHLGKVLSHTQKKKSANFVYLLITKKNQISQINVFSAFSYMGDCKILGFLKLFLGLCTLTISGQCPVFLHPEFPSRHTHWEGRRWERSCSGWWLGGHNILCFTEMAGDIFLVHNYICFTLKNKISCKWLWNSS